MNDPQEGNRECERRRRRAETRAKRGGRERAAHHAEEQESGREVRCQVERVVTPHVSIERIAGSAEGRLDAGSEGVANAGGCERVVDGERQAGRRAAIGFGRDLC
jgi:hypothetical protein